MPTLPLLHQAVPSFPTILLVSTALRVALILYSQWHDSHSVVKYTDVDYRVFSDAAVFILQPENRAQGPLGSLVGVGNPYGRETYRYTPLLAVLLTPNAWFPSFGKYLFAACDIVNGVLIYALLVSIILPQKPPGSTASAKPSPPDPSVTTYATLLTTIHLLNPLVFTISTRGSSESVLSLFVLLTLHFALNHKWDAAAVWLGVSTHWKIYPVIYGVACLGVVGGAGAGWRRYTNWAVLRFGVISAGTFIALGFGCWLVWGHPFLYEAYLYHLHRLDHRHNFSPYFYLTYLTYPSLSQHDQPPPPALWRKVLRSPLTSFVPQMMLCIFTGLLFGRREEDLVFTWFVQTVVFVLFNKVCTSQYFLWYLTLVPLLIPRLSMSRWHASICLGLWVLAQAVWLSDAYRLEFLGENVFRSLWLKSLGYVAANAWILVQIMEGYGTASGRK